MRIKSSNSKRVLSTVSALALTAALGTPAFAADAAAQKPEDQNATVEAVATQEKADKESNASNAKESPNKTGLTKAMVIGDLTFSYPADYQLSMQVDGMLQIISPDQSVVILARATDNEGEITSYGDLKALAEGLVPEDAQDVKTDDATIDEVSVNRISYTIGDKERAMQCIVNCVYTKDASYLISIATTGNAGTEVAKEVIESFAVEPDTDEPTDNDLEALSSVLDGAINKQGIEVFQNPELAKPLEQANLDLIAYLDEWDSSVATSHAADPYTEESYKAFNDASQDARRIAEDRSSTAEDLAAAKQAYDDAWYGLVTITSTMQFGIGETVENEDFRVTLNNAYISSHLESPESSTSWDSVGDTTFVILEFTMEALNSNMLPIDSNAVVNPVANYNGNTYKSWDYDYIGGSGLWLSAKRAYMDANMPTTIYVYTYIPADATSGSVVVDATIAGQEKKITL